MNIIFDEKDLAKLDTKGMEKLTGIISDVANADSVAEKVAEHIGCKPVTATPEVIEEDKKRTAKKTTAKKTAKKPEPEPADEEEDADDVVEISDTEEEFDRATVLKAIQSLCSTDKSALAKVKKAVKESSQETEKHKLSACTDEELKELCEEIGVDV